MTLIIIIITLALSSVIIFFLGIKRKKVTYIIASIVLFCLALLSTIYLFFKLGKSLYKKVESSKITFLEPRKAEDIYIALFDKKDSCVKIQNFKDQIVPRLDEGIFLEFTTCPNALNRILRLNKYEDELIENTHHLDTSNIVSQQNIDWFKPNTLGNVYHVSTFTDEKKTGCYVAIYFNMDSTKVFYADISD